jgi:hypothetical protein
MPIYTPPVFVPAYNVWKAPTVPSTSAPTFGAVSLQVYVYSRQPPFLFHPGSGRWLPCISIREPFAAGNHLRVDDIVSHATNLLPGIQYYRVQFSQTVHAGFSNAYYTHYSLQCNANGSIPYLPLPS